MKKSLLKQVLLLAVCTTGANHIYAQINSSPLSEPVRHTIAPGRSTAIEIKTMPAAVYTLHPEGQEDGKYSLKLFADDEGIIRFHVRPAAETEQHEQLAADCQADGKTTTQRIELRAATSPTAAFPAPGTLQANQPRQKGDVRPALTGDPCCFLKANCCSADIHLGPTRKRRHSLMLRG